MATIFDQNDDEEQGQQQVPQTGAPTQPGGVIAPVGQTSQPAQTGSPFAANRNSSPTSNLNKYIEANQTNIGQNIAGGVKSNLEKAENKFSNVKSTYDQAKEGAASLYNQGQQFQQNLQDQDYQSITNDQARMNAFQQIRDRDTTQLDSLQNQFQTGGEELNPIYNQASQATQDFGTEAGRFKLLQDKFRNRQYNSGQQSLDELLMETDPGLKGDTAGGGGTKKAIMETGLQVNVPLFINEGDKIKIDTVTCSYMKRVK